MQKDNIVHFVGFITAVEPEDFVPQWESFARNSSSRPGGMSLQQLQDTGMKRRFKYLSRHDHKDGNIRFSFMKERSSVHFPDQQVRVVQAGGYACVQSAPGKRKDVSVMVFVNHKKTDNGFYSGLSFPRPNIYQAYFENCLFSSVLEFLVPGNKTTGLLEELRSVEDIEVSLYRECMVPHL